MKITKKAKKAALISLKERWYPLRDAKTTDEMKDILQRTDCELCAKYNRETCGNCPLDDGNCANEYNEWYDARFKEDFIEAHDAARCLCKRLEKIAGVTP